MLLNFCDPCLRTDVTCSTVSSDGYEATNLVNNSNKGFLAYSAIKPPVHLEFVFICNIQLSHVVIYPQVGAQRSVGFQLSVKSSNSNQQSFLDVSSAYIKKDEAGVFFYRSDLGFEEAMVPSNFSQRYMKRLPVLNYVNALRLSIVKTDNSVPALGEIQIWGKVSPKCSKDISMGIMSLWMNRNDNQLPTPLPNESNSSQVIINQSSEHSESQKSEPIPDDSLDIPDDFLDPITCEIMTQPVVLPSGKIIDQKTLEKHAQHEALRGRVLSDPFTGLCLNEIRKPIIAYSLKARIDKFLLDNSTNKEVIKLPRVLGSKKKQGLEEIKMISQSTNRNYSENTVTDVSSISRKRTSEVDNNSVKHRRIVGGHSLPVATIIGSSNLSRTHAKFEINSVKKNLIRYESDQVQVTEKISIPYISSNIPKCKCCAETISYKLPCNHFMCRKTLLSLDKNACTICKVEFKSSDPERVHSS
ncbi:hypothetical protein TKK_0013221 [Trichogramma kaykai]|uniref:U-box domain-containing protein n=1 Tax=Trichogramma kaykai TaxID=54128 RepID=A0ABD2WKH8_9HYME